MVKIKDRRNKAAELFKLKPGPLLPINIQEASYIPPGMTRAYQNNRYTVMVYENTNTTHGIATVARIQRHDDRPFDKHWSEMQAIKNEIFGAEVTAVEYYPAVSKLEDLHNIYWMFIFPEGVLPIMTNW
jgi:hypothetical protein